MTPSEKWTLLALQAALLAAVCTTKVLQSPAERILSEMQRDCEEVLRIIRENGLHSDSPQVVTLLRPAGFSYPQ